MTYENIKNSKRLMSEKLKELHEVLATELLKRVKDPDAKSADLNVARQFLKDNNVDAVPTDDSPLKKLIEELPFDEKEKISRQKLTILEIFISNLEAFTTT